MASTRLVPIVALSTVFALVACAPPATTSPSAAPVAEPSPTPVPVDAPETRVPATCESLMDLAAVSRFMGSTTAAISPQPANHDGTPVGTTIEQLGGLECHWGNGIVDEPVAGEPWAAQDVMLNVMPEGREAALEYVDVYSSGPSLGASPYGPETLPPRCVGADSGPNAKGYCELHGWVGSVWVDFMLDGIVMGERSDAELLDAFRPVVDPLVAELAELPPATERWQPSVASPSGAESCDDLATVDGLAPLTGLDGGWFDSYRDGPQVGMRLYAIEQSGALDCQLGVANLDDTIGMVSLLPYGAWEYEERAPEWRRSGASAVELAGVAADGALLGCGDPASECRLDVRIDGHWLQVAIDAVPSPDEWNEDRISWIETSRANVSEIAELVVAGLRSSG